MSEYTLTTWLVLMFNKFHLDQKNVAIYYEKKPTCCDKQFLRFSKVYQSNSCYYLFGGKF